MPEWNGGSPIASVILVDRFGVPVSFGGSGASSTQVQGTSAVGAAPTGNPVEIAVRSSSGGAIASLTANTQADAGTNARNALNVAARNEWWSGTNWNLARGDTVSGFMRTPPRTKTASAVTAGSTSSQQLFAANALRSRIMIQNLDAAINVHVNIGAAATTGAGSIRLAPGATLDLTGTSEAVNLIAASGTPPITAWEF